MTAAENLLDRHLALAATKTLREPAGAALRCIVDDCLRVFERCSSSAKGSDENLGVLFPFLHLVEMLDAVEVQLDSSVVSPAMVSLRSAFETYLAVLYVTEGDTLRRGAAWVVAEIHRRLSNLDRWDPSTVKGKQFRKDVASDLEANDISVPMLADLERDRTGYARVLRKPHLADAATEYDRVKSVTKKHPKFHAIWNGPTDLEQLARYLKRAGQYQILYRHWSAAAHGEQLARQLRDAGGGIPAITTLRSPSEMKTCYGFAMSFGLKAADALLRCYRPDEVRSSARRNWYITEIRPAYLTVTGASDD